MDLGAASTWVESMGRNKATSGDYRMRREQAEGGTPRDDSVEEGNSAGG